MVPRLTVAAASRFAALDLKGRHTTDYYGAVEYQVRTATLWGSSALVFGRYGFAFRPGGAGFEHGLSAGLGLEDRLEVDLGWTREQGYGTTYWRPVVAVTLRAGRYRVAVARGSGLNDVGSAFRISLSAQLRP
jgi:hypothetical protein